MCLLSKEAEINLSIAVVIYTLIEVMSLRVFMLVSNVFIIPRRRNQSLLSRHCYPAGLAPWLGARSVQGIHLTSRGGLTRSYFTASANSRCAAEGG